MSAKGRVTRSVEEIQDTSTAGVVDVLLSAYPFDSQYSEQLQEVAGRLQRRRLLTSARDLLSPSYTDDGTADALRKVDNFTSAAPGRQAARSLASHPAIREGAARTVGFDHSEIGYREKRPIRTLWASYAIRACLPRDSLAKIVSDMPGLTFVQRNRVLLRSPLVSPSRVPDVVEDNKLTSWGIHKIGAVSSWGATGSRGAGVVVGLLDTGIDATHPDLADKVLGWREFDLDGHAIENSAPHDGDQHGTHCGGVIVGGNASGRYIGVAPDAKLAVAKVLGKERATDAQILAGFGWILERGVDAVNLSLGGISLTSNTPDLYTPAFLHALELGIPVVTAIGNNGEDTAASPGDQMLALSVGATDYLDRVAGFSAGRTVIIRESAEYPQNILPIIYTKPDLTAPGVGIYSSVPGNIWTSFSGTSMAAPHACGAIALLLSATDIPIKLQGKERVIAIERFLCGAVDEFGEAGQGNRYGFGRLNVFRSIGLARASGM